MPSMMDPIPKATTLPPAEDEARQTSWMAAMRRGDDQAAWTIADQVLEARNRAERDDPAQPYHKRWVWDGTPVDGQTVLVRCYHGLGDTLQFARYLPALRARAAHVTLEVQPELLPLLATLPGPDLVLPFIQHAPAPRSPCDIEIMELAHALRLAPEAAPSPSLRVTPVPTPSRAIGLCWQAGGWDQARSLRTSDLGPILAAGYPWYCLQPRPAPPGFVNPAGCPGEIAQTAGVIAGLDLVVTVDSMVAHLAGTLGRPTWLLLRHDADWRWMTGEPRSRWYPSMRLFRQPEPGAWPPVVAKIVEELGGTLEQYQVMGGSPIRPSVQGE